MDDEVGFCYFPEVRFIGQFGLMAFWFKGDYGLEGSRFEGNMGETPHESVVHMGLSPVSSLPMGVSP